MKRRTKIGLIAVVASLLAVGMLIALQPEAWTAPPGSNTGASLMSAEARVTIHHVSPDINKDLVYRGFSASGCGQSFGGSSLWSFSGVSFYLQPVNPCSQGWTYSLDPSVTITNEGHDFIQGKLYGVTKSTTLVTTDYAVILGISTSATAIAVTDNYAAAGPCDSANIYNTAGSGAQPAAATTKTAGTPSAGSVTTTLAITFSITATISSAQAACIITETVGSLNPYIFGEVAFGPDSFVSGDSLTETFTMTST